MLEFHGQTVGAGADADSDFLNAFGTMPDGIESTHIGHESCGGAYIRGSFVAFDVLLTHAKSHTKSGITLGVDAPTDDTARESALEGLGEGEEASVRTTEAHGQTEALGITHGAIGTHLAGSLHQSQRHQVSGHTDEDTLLMALADEARPILSLTKLVGILHEGGEVAAVELGLGSFTSDNLNTTGSGIGLHHSQGLGQNTLVDEDLADTILLGLTAATVEEHDHGLASGGCLVKQTGVAQGHASHAGNHSLVVHQGFETSLGYLGLVRSVGGVPARVLKDIAHDDGGSDSAVVAHTNIGAVEFIFLGQRTHMVQELVLAHALGQGHGLFETDGGGHSLLDELVHGFHADNVEHFLLFGGIGNAIMA